jgi:predicted NACHT family NTPase
MPLDQVFDTGVNVIVLGEAGAGKTTSLQMYAEHRQENNSKLIIPIPLAHAIQNYIKQGMNSEQNADFEECIATYLNQMGIPISIEEFKYTLTKENIILLLDGLDEAIKSAPWLTNKIALLSEKHKSNVQIIVSSRTSGGYVNDIPFLTVTLLPFTLEQRNKFIEKWFGEEEKEVIGKIKKHLSENNAISDIVKNPLLITTLCVLAKHDVPLPNTEIKLYEHRIELLTGYYDSVKNINSRISSTPQILEKLARKLAFHLHTKNKREEDIVTLQNASIKLIAKTEGHKGAITALNELIDPCNILMPMSEDGKYGFDHLRYQEHLAAQELIFSRSIDIPLLLKNTWWRDTLVLFAQMEDDLMWLVKNVAEKKKVKMYEEGLKAMSNARPEREKIAFQDIMEKSIALETADFRSIETGTDEFYDDELDI